MSPTKSGTIPESPVSGNANLNSIDGRLINLDTGELSSGDVGSLLDAVFGAATAERSEPFSERAPQRREAPGLVKRTISHRSLSLSVHADVVVVRGVSAVHREGSDEQRESAPEGQQSKRGRITGFSRRSRRRLIVSLAMARNVSGGYFCTLTFPDSVVAAFHEPSDWGEYAHRCLDIFLKRLMRLFPHACGWWRLEFQTRKSGEFEGEDVPHFHLLIFGLPPDGDIRKLRRWWSDVWANVVGSGDEQHYKAGTNVRKITSRRHAMNYVSKYAAKEAVDIYAVGRRWGEFGDLDKSPSVEIDLSVDEWVLLKRIIRGWLKSRGSSYHRRLAAAPADVGAFFLGLGDHSLAVYWAFDPTIFRMLRAIPNREMNVPARLVM